MLKPKARKARKPVERRKIVLRRIERNFISRGTRLNNLYNKIGFVLFGSPMFPQNRIPYLSREEASQVIREIHLFSRLFRNYHKTLSEKAGVLGEKTTGLRHFLIDNKQANKIAQAYLELKKRFPDLAKKEASDF